jgi:hypothetical protein
MRLLQNLDCRLAKLAAHNTRASGNLWDATTSWTQCPTASSGAPDLLFSHCIVGTRRDSGLLRSLHRNHAKDDQNSPSKQRLEHCPLHVNCRQISARFHNTAMVRHLQTESMLRLRAGRTSNVLRKKWSGPVLPLQASPPGSYHHRKLVASAHDSLWPIATLPQEFMSALAAKADKPEPTRMTQRRHRGRTHGLLWECAKSL